MKKLLAVSVLILALVIPSSVGAAGSAQTVMNRAVGRALSSAVSVLNNSGCAAGINGAVVSITVTTNQGSAGTTQDVTMWCP